mgnify:FL=1
MATLNSSQRSTLESAVIYARKKAEKGAVNALKALAVDQAEPFTHMTPNQRHLRNRLRVKARLLGDILQPDYKQDIDHLSYELAYEYWHKMLFAKFLESNGLLIHPTHDISVSLDECEEMAVEEGYPDKWTAAAYYASKMLPAIFRPEDPLMQLDFSTEDRIALENILAGIDETIFLADDSLGWVYQFWQSEAKATINASGDKIDGARLPAVTQLFTEPYMVHFLIDNTLGAWWVSRNPGVTPPVKFEYLRMHKPDTELVEVPAAGSFEGWPDKTAKITTLDPCMGSGHFVVSLFLVMVKLRMFEEGLTAEEATDLIITENLHGLEIDPRCTQLAAFNLALTAWKFCGHYKELPEMNLACSGIAPKGKKEDWVKLVSNISDPLQKEKMMSGMEMLYDHFQLAPELGSLLNPANLKTDYMIASFQELQPVLVKALKNETDKDQVERGVIAAGIAKAGDLLNLKYTMVITNVPYLGANRMSKVLNQYCENKYPSSKSDLATVFIERSYRLASIKGCIVTVSPQGWINLDYFKHFRKELFKSKSLNFLIGLGSGAFVTISGEVVKALLSSIQNNGQALSYMAIDTNHEYSIELKINNIKNGLLSILEFQKQSKNPDCRIMFGEVSNFPLLSEYADSHQGAHTFDINRFRLYFWEMNECLDNWRLHSSSPSGVNDYSGYQYVSYKREDDNEFGEIIKAIANDPNETRSVMWKAGHKAWGKFGISCAWMGNLPVSLYIGQIFDNSAAAIIPKNIDQLLPIYCFCSSPMFSKEIRKINQKMQVADSTLIKVPFDLEYWQKVASEKYPNGLPKPSSDDPTQWLFHGHPVKSDNPLQVAVARLLGYHWPAETDTKMELSDEARQLIKEVQVLNAFADDDGIVCIPSVNGEPAAADRLRELLKTAYASEWNNFTIEELLKQTGSNTTSLETWLREYFFEQHFKLFQHRPFIWHIWDGRKDGFSVLVNYHKLTKEALEKVIFRYLGDWIHQCEARKNESGAEGQLMAAKELKKKLEAILEGEPPYDIFVRWKPMHQQPIGWIPDLNDGVRMNIRPFVEAGVLRKRPNIKWDKDRGKNPPNSPWGDDRINDTHLSLAQKREALENWKLTQQNKTETTPNPNTFNTIE